VFGVRVERDANVLVLAATGELDAYAAPALAASLEAAGISACGRFVADLSTVSFLDSTALGLLVGVVKDITRRGGEVRVVLPTTTARRIFEITTLDRTLPLASSRVEALRELSARDDSTG
jgi:anti-sigma B factor antagonist